MHTYIYIYIQISNRGGRLSCGFLHVGASELWLFVGFLLACEALPESHRSFTNSAGISPESVPRGDDWAASSRHRPNGYLA